jgi:hypothetical protein
LEPHLAVQSTAKLGLGLHFFFVNRAVCCRSSYADYGRGHMCQTSMDRLEIVKIVSPSLFPIRPSLSKNYINNGIYKQKNVIVLWHI